MQTRDGIWWMGRSSGVFRNGECIARYCRVQSRSREPGGNAEERKGMAAVGVVREIRASEKR